MEIKIYPKMLVSKESSIFKNLVTSYNVFIKTHNDKIESVLNTIATMYSQKGLVDFNWENLTPKVDNLLNPVKKEIEIAFKQAFDEISIEIFKDTSESDEVIEDITNFVNIANSLMDEDIFNVEFFKKYLK